MTFQETIKTLGKINQRIYGVNPYAEVAVENQADEDTEDVGNGEKVDREELEAE